MKKIVLLSFTFVLISSIGIGQTETSNNEKINLQSPSSVSLFQSNSTNGVWATGTITADRWGIFEDATSSKERLTVLPGGNVGIGITNPSMRLQIAGSVASGNNNTLTLDRNEWFNYGNVSGYGFINWFAKANTNRNDFINTHGSVKASSIRGGNGEIKFYTSAVNNGITQPSALIERMTIESNGNVGIGITNPNATLHIKDQANSSATSFQLNNRIKFRGDGVMFWGSNADHGRLSWDTNKAIIGGQAGKDLSLLAGGGEKITVKTNGNVGIGTSNPDAKLRVQGTHSLGRFYTDTDGRFEIQATRSSSTALNTDLVLSAQQHIVLDPNTNGTSGNVGIGTSNPNQKLQIDALDSAIQIQLNRTGSNTGKADFGVDNTGLHYWVGGYDGFGKEEFFIGVNGNVGIGTNDTKGFKLGVKGKIAAEEVKVALYNAWPDYVFENDYNLPTLQEVENHIEEKGHLENIPSAAEVTENGIQLGEMNAKLLQKIEELTLYMIEQNKKTEILIKEVEVLKAKNAVLEQKMK